VHNFGSAVGAWALDAGLSLDAIGFALSELEPMIRSSRFHGQCHSTSLAYPRSVFGSGFRGTLKLSDCTMTLGCFKSLSGTSSSVSAGPCPSKADRTDD
jgi:hypothetical protein